MKVEYYVRTEKGTIGKFNVVKTGETIPNFNEIVRSFTKEVLNDKIEIIEDKKLKHLEDYVDFANLKDDEKFDYLYEMISRIIDKINEVE